MLGDRFDSAVVSATAGDPDAFAELWRDAQPMLLRYLRVTSGDLADDIASQTWLRVVESLPSFRGSEPQFRRWLVTIARNLHVDQVRRESRRPLTLMEDPGEVEVGTMPDAAQEVLERLSTQDALRFVARLPQSQAELIMLRVVMGLEVADVAEITGKTSGAVRVATHRALRRLEELLTDPSGEGVTLRSPVASSDQDD